MKLLPIKDYPWLLRLNLSDVIDDGTNDKLVEQSIESDNKERSNLEEGSYNTRMDDTWEIKNLYNIFKNVCHKFFSNLPENCMSMNPSKSLGCAYVSYGYKIYDSYWHNHFYRASVNGVYYASVPDSDGTLSLLVENGEEVEIKPFEKHLFLMPGWLSHKPNPCKSEEPRISINMEFLSNTRPILNPNNFDIKTYQQWDKKSLILW